MGVKIWVDDIRIPPLDCTWCKTYKQAIFTLDALVACNEEIDLICLDHDLGEDKSGYDVAKHIVEYQIPIKEFYIQSKNPVGQFNIRQLLTHYGYKERYNYEG